MFALRRHYRGRPGGPQLCGTKKALRSSVPGTPAVPMCWPLPTWVNPTWRAGSTSHKASTLTPAVRGVSEAMGGRSQPARASSEAKHHTRAPGERHVSLIYSVWRDFCGFSWSSRAPGAVSPGTWIRAGTGPKPRCPKDNGRPDSPPGAPGRPGSMTKTKKASSTARTKNGTYKAHPPGSKGSAGERGEHHRPSFVKMFVNPDH